MKPKGVYFRTVSIDRIGIGQDSHRLVEGRTLVLGGVKIPFEKGLLGHSDGDAVLHAVADAMLGAAGLADLGEMFPDTDPAYRNMDSRKILRQVAERIHELGYGVVNVDITIHAERPKLGVYKPKIRDVVAGILNIPASAVAVKAKTAEGLDAVGQGRAVQCLAAVGLAVIGQRSSEY